MEGTLVIEDKDLKVRFKGKKGLKNVGFNKTEMAQIFLDYKKDNWMQLVETPVEFEFNKKGEPCKVRPKGEVWVKPRNQVVEPQDSSDGQSQVQGDFHNPYNFVPALPRNKVLKNSCLGDREPAKHDRYHSGYWSGKISVKLTTKTPLLIPDASQMDQSGEHKIYPLRKLGDLPYLPPTSIKGMLRSAYEAVTNSRLSVFEEKHDERLFYRMSASDGLSLVPAIVQGNEIKLMRGTTPGYPSLNNWGRWKVCEDLMYAAWLPSYHRGSSDNLPHPNINHGDRVRVWLEKYQKEGKFKYWKVRKIVPYSETLGSRPDPSPRIGTHSPVSPVSPENIICTEGYLCITKQNIQNKHDERVFFNNPNQSNDDDHTYNIDELSKDWEYLIRDYQQLHEDEHRDENMQWSRHVNGKEEYKLVRSDNRPTLCYAFVDDDQRITSLYPVMISRAIYDKSPSGLLSPGDDIFKLQPAQKLSDLSPADRVFGWVNQNGEGSYRGNLRIYNVRCTHSDPIQELGVGLPLAILGQPKPQQGRFYAAQNKEGKPFDAGSSKQQFYQAGTGLRGRKVYPHHRSLPNNYWCNPLEDRTKDNNEGTFQEYRRPKKLLEQKPTQNQSVQQGSTQKPIVKKLSEQQDSQNRSITEWVKPDVTFEFEIEVTNLSSVELGALLWLLELPEEHYHRLGGGKPLGFGSVALAVERTDLRNGEELQYFYSSLFTLPTPLQFDRAKSIAAFKQAVEASYGSDFSEVSFIKAFCRSAQGFEDGKPIHYPRITTAPDPDGKSFEWFVENERNSKRQYSLGSLSDDSGLPIKFNDR